MIVQSGGLAERHLLQVASNDGKLCSFCSLGNKVEVIQAMRVALALRCVLLRLWLRLLALASCAGEVIAAALGAFGLCIWGGQRNC